MEGDTFEILLVVGFAVALFYVLAVLDILLCTISKRVEKHGKKANLLGLRSAKKGSSFHGISREATLPGVPGRLYKGRARLSQVSQVREKDNQSL